MRQANGIIKLTVLGLQKRDAKYIYCMQWDISTNFPRSLGIKAKFDLYVLISKQLLA
jgi:hypothetical protein